MRGESETGNSGKIYDFLRGTISAISNRLPGKAPKIGLAMIATLVFMAIFAPFISPYPPTTASGGSFAGPSLKHLLGTDDIGEDLFSQLIWASRGSLLVAFLAGGMSAAIGTVVGLVSGYRGGKSDEALMRSADVVLTLPLLPLLIVLASVVPATIYSVILIIGLVSWPLTARAIRSQTITLKSRPFVDTARLSGMRDTEIMFRTILPNEIALTLAYGAFAAVTAVI